MPGAIGLPGKGGHINENWLANWKTGISLCTLYKQKLNPIAKMPRDYCAWISFIVISCVLLLNITYPTIPIFTPYFHTSGILCVHACVRAPCMKNKNTDNNIHTCVCIKAHCCMKPLPMFQYVKSQRNLQTFSFLLDTMKSSLQIQPKADLLQCRSWWRISI
jgi:hypothetical protein